MENAFLVWVENLLRASGYQILMFFLAGIALELAVEFIKATLYPKTKKDAEGNVKSCPRWLGMALGAVITVVYLAMAYAASGIAGFYIPAGPIFLPVWFILFYVYQFKAIKVSKWLRDKMFPSLKDPDYVKPAKVKKEKEKKLADMTYEELLEFKRLHPEVK